MSLPRFFCIIRFRFCSLLLLIQTLSYSIHFHVAVLHKVLAQFWLGCLTQQVSRRQDYSYYFSETQLLANYRGRCLLIRSFSQCEALIFLGRKEKSSQQTIFFCLSNERTPLLPKGEWGRGTGLFLFQFQDVWLLSPHGYYSYPLVLGTWPFYPAFHFACFCFGTIYIKLLYN